MISRKQQKRKRHAHNYRHVSNFANQSDQTIPSQTKPNSKSQQKSTKVKSQTKKVRHTFLIQDTVIAFRSDTRVAKANHARQQVHAQVALAATALAAHVAALIRMPGHRRLNRAAEHHCPWISRRFRITRLQFIIMQCNATQHRHISKESIPACFNYFLYTQ